MNKQALGAIVAIIVVLGGVYFYTTNRASAPGIATTTTTSTTTSTGAPIGSDDGTGVSDNFALGIDGEASLGSYLIAYNGATVYTYAPDKPGVSNCSGQCAVNWPPYVVPVGSTLNLQAGVNGAISTIVRADGTTQVTYKGMPLYFYIKDKNSGDTLGQGVGGVWYVVKP